jgi:programmed cell death 6-interacting protein
MYCYVQALESRAGADADWSSDEGIKAACRHFQQAAGIFLHLRDKLSAGLIGTLTTDLTPNGLSMVSTLMLAQAQGCFFHKATRDRKTTNIKAGIIAKLAMQVRCSATCT